MTVQRVEQNKSNLGNGVQSALIGGTMGYAAKYALPLTSQEMDIDYKHIINIIKKQSVNTKNEFLEGIKNVSEKSLAQDAFIKSSKDLAKRSICTYNLNLKKIRPTAPFVIAGAIIGLVSSFLHNTFKTDTY